MVVTLDRASSMGSPCAFHWGLEAMSNSNSQESFQKKSPGVPSQSSRQHSTRHPRPQRTGQAGQGWLVWGRSYNDTVAHAPQTPTVKHGPEKQRGPGRQTVLPRTLQAPESHSGSKLHLFSVTPGRGDDPLPFRFQGLHAQRPGVASWIPLDRLGPWRLW